RLKPMTMEIITEIPFRTAKRQRRITGGKLTGQKPALKMKEVWSIRARLELKKRVRDLALFNLAIDSKLRGQLLGQCGDRELLRVAEIGAHRAQDLSHTRRGQGGRVRLR